MKPIKVSLARETTCGEDHLDPILYPVCVKNSGLAMTETSEGDGCINEHADGGGEVVITGSDINGSLASTIYFEQVGLYFTMLFGDPSTVDNGDGTYTHTFDTTKRCKPCWSLENIFNNDDDCVNPPVDYVERYNGVKASTYAHEVSGRGLNTLSLGLVASKFRTSRDNPNPIVALATGKQVNMDRFALDTNRATVKVNNQPAKLSKFGINVDLGMQVDELIGNQKDVWEKELSVNGSVAGLFDAVLHETLVKNLKNEVEIKYENADNTKSLTYYMKEVQFAYKTTPAVYGEKLMLDTTYIASRSATSTERLKITLVNAQANYA